jgi:hypothetical protein
MKYRNKKNCLSKPGFNFISLFFNLLHFASTAGGLRTCAGTAFASLEKYATHFSNPDKVGTEPNEAPYTGTGERANIIFSGTFFYSTNLIAILNPAKAFLPRTLTSICRGASFALVTPQAV